MSLNKTFPSYGIRNLNKQKSQNKTTTETIIITKQWINTLVNLVYFCFNISTAECWSKSKELYKGDNHQILPLAGLQGGRLFELSSGTSSCRFYGNPSWTGGQLYAIRALLFEETEKWDQKKT